MVPPPWVDYGTYPTLEPLIKKDYHDFACVIMKLFTYGGKY